MGKKILKFRYLDIFSFAGHAESYNPPPEYLFDDKEMKQWNKLKNAPWKRKLHFVPQKFESLRKVPSYPR